MSRHGPLSAQSPRDTGRVAWHEAFDELGVTIAARHELLRAGATSAGLTSAVRAGYLIRVRRDHYALPHTDRHVLRAVRVGGRLACASALRDFGIFGFDAHRTHIHVTREMSRMRSPGNRRTPLAASRADCLLHWSELIDPTAGTEFRVGVVDALAQIVRCDHPWFALGSIESALFLGRIDETDVSSVFASVPQRFQHLRALIDPRSEAGQETVLRRAFSEAGMESEIQVRIPGVGRVDGLLEGRLIWEADSRLAHDGWELHVRDRDRDIDAARQGYMSLRPAYSRTMFATGDVVEAAARLLAATRHNRTVL